MDEVKNINSDSDSVMTYFLKNNQWKRDLDCHLNLDPTYSWCYEWSIVRQ